MNLEEEIKIVKFIMSMCKTIYINRDELIQFDYKMGDESELRFETSDECDIISVRYKESYSSGVNTIFTIEPSDYTNIRANETWTFNCKTHNSDFNNKYSIINSADQNLEDDEAFIDSLLDDKRIMTEDEYFQCSLLHPNMPTSYNDVLDILNVLHNTDKNDIGEVSVIIFMEPCVTMNLIRKIRRIIMFKTGIEFL